MTREEYEDLARLYDDSPETIGNWGEIITASTLRDELKLRVLRTIYIGSSQIDMVAISPYGVFVIENKNYHGVVTGNVADRYWNVRYTDGGKVYQLYNPIMQNEKHADNTKKVLDLLGFPRVPVYNPVIFNNMVDLRVERGKSRNHLYTLEEFVTVYKGVEVAPIVSEDSCRSLEDLFRKYQDCSDEARLEHLQSIGAS